MDNRSISQEVVAIVQEYLARPSQDVKKANEAFMTMVGSWPDDRTAQAIAADIHAFCCSGLRFNVDPHVFD